MNELKKLTILVVILMCVAFLGTAMAVPSGKTVEFSASPEGKVVFDGKTHADKGNKCNDCHTKIFERKKGTAKITKADHDGGKFCFTCHDGTKAFAPKDNCAKCHKK